MARHGGVRRHCRQRGPEYLPQSLAPPVVTSVHERSFSVHAHAFRIPETAPLVMETSGPHAGRARRGAALLLDQQRRVAYE